MIRGDKMYTPKCVVSKYNDLDFNQLYDNGYRIIISDLDNTLAPYTNDTPSEELIEQINYIKTIGFKIYLISNNKKERIEHFSKLLGIDGYLSNAKKPNPKRLARFLDENNLDKELIIALGDQLVTDILGFNRLGLYSVLVKTIDKKTQKWYTKINRLREKKILNNIKKTNNEIYRKIEEIYE